MAKRIVNTELKVIRGVSKPSEDIVRKIRSDNQHKENGARLAHSFGVYETSGWGEFESEDAIVFDAPYLERPSVSYGASLLDDDDTAKVRDTRFPRCSGIVKDWDIDKNGLYRAAWVLVVVEDQSPFVEPTDPDPDPDYNIVHDFTFLGTAMKDIPPFMRGNLKEV